MYVVRLKQAKELYALTFGNLLVAKDIRVARRSNIGQPEPVPIVEVEGKIVQFRNSELKLLTDINRMIGTLCTAPGFTLTHFTLLRTVSHQQLAVLMLNTCSGERLLFSSCFWLPLLLPPLPLLLLVLLLLAAAG